MFSDPTKEGLDHSAADQENTISLLVYFKNTIKACRLVPNRPVVIGRSAPADLVVPSDSLSRRHARFELRDDELWIEDLKSTNGTTVNGEKIDRCQINTFDQISLGGIRVGLHLYGDSEEAAGFGNLSHDEFVDLVGREIVRAKSFDRTVALVVAHFEKRIESDRWHSLVSTHLRPVDRWARYGPNTFEICLPEMPQAQAVDFAQKLREEWGGEASFYGGIAIYPSAATSSHELFDVCLDSAHRATKAQPIVSSKAQSTRVLQMPAAPDKDGIIIQSESMRELYTLVDRIAGAALPVLVLGETGTGKEVLARAIHVRSHRKDGPLRSINCAAIPRNLIESTLFGHRKGSFTGADRDNQGVFEAADGGTLLLDEIGELPLAAQAALLRVLETKRIVRIGSHDEQEVDVRIVAATNRDLEQMSVDGDFRTDLFYRLNAFSLKIPALRDRPEDIIPMAEAFLGHANEANHRDIKSFAPEALEMLCLYRWPGNVRELKNVIEHATVVATSSSISAFDLPDRIKVDFEHTSSLQGPATTTGKTKDAQSFKQRVQACEAALIWTALEESGWNRDRVSQSLRIPRRTLSHKIRSFGIQRREANATERASINLCLDDFGKRVMEGGLEFKSQINRFEASLIEEALVATGGNKTEAARKLDIPLRTLVFKIGAFGITAG